VTGFLKSVSKFNSNKYYTKILRKITVHNVTETIKLDTMVVMQSSYGTQR